MLAPVVGVLTEAGVATRGVGGDESAAAGLDLDYHARALAAHGLIEAAASVPAWWVAFRGLRRALEGACGLVLVDFPEMNLRLMRHAATRGLPVAYLAPPQAWAWRSHRVAAVRSARWIGCLLPFEAAWYRARGVPAEWVGHPMGARPPAAMPNRPAVALLPGSRDAAVRQLLPRFLAAAAYLRREAPALRFHVGVASTVDRMFVHRALVAADLPATIHDGSVSALSASTVALCGAGTATLEAVVLGRPVVVAARMHAVTAAVAARLVDVPAFGLPNLVLGRSVFPECVQAECTPIALAREVRRLLETPDRYAASIAEVREKIMPDQAFGPRVAARVRAAIGV